MYDDDRSDSQYDRAARQGRIASIRDVAQEQIDRIRGAARERIALVRGGRATQDSAPSVEETRSMEDFSVKTYLRSRFDARVVREAEGPDTAAPEQHETPRRWGILGG